MRMTPATIVLAITIAASSPIAADWNVTQFRDDRTSNRVNVATLPDSGGQARLRVQCINGRTFSAVVLAKAVTAPDVVRLRTTYKFDAARAVPRMAMLVDKGRELWLWVDEPETTLLRITRSRRLLIELFPSSRRHRAARLRPDGRGSHHSAGAVPAVRGYIPFRRSRAAATMTSSFARARSRLMVISPQSGDSITLAGSR